MAPATPPPSCKSLLAALTIASASTSVKSPCSKTILSALSVITESRENPTPSVWLPHPCSRKRRDRICVPVVQPSHIVQSTGTDDTCRQACDANAGECSNARRDPRDLPAQRVPSDG